MRLMLHSPLERCIAFRVHTASVLFDSHVFYTSGDLTEDIGDCSYGNDFCQREAANHQHQTKNVASVQDKKQKNQCSLISSNAVLFGLDVSGGSVG